VGSSERTDCSNVAVRVALTEPAAHLYAQGGYDACVEDADGAFSCWGAHGYRIGTAPTPDRLRPEPAPTFDGAQSFANAFIMTCWLDADGAPWCIGDNGVGELGQGDFALYVTPVRPRLEDPTAPALEGLVEIATSTTFGGTACARTSEQLYCWGQNDLGQIGDPAPHTICVSGIDEFDCTPWVTPIAFERTADIARLSLGSQHTCALLTDATVWCWGQNRNGELALGSPGMQDVAARRAPVEVTNLTDIAQIELGARHSCARRNDGTVWCWGSNDFGQLGDGVLDHPEPSCMNGSSLVDCTSVPVQVAGIDDAVDLDVGRHHSCVIRSDATVWCWGINDYYEVAPGTRDSVFTPTQVTSL
ncbi:MAG: hypothetical protein J0L92_37785, partial [Deltaproteobacteria bacterium]|nr:hypothetical protein [Deltaproteobacteria bacterium]